MHLGTEAVRLALLETGGNVTRAAARLGIHRATLWEHTRGPSWDRMRRARARQRHTARQLRSRARARLRALLADLAADPGASHGWRPCLRRWYAAAVLDGRAHAPLCLRCAAAGLDACPLPPPSPPRKAKKP